MICENVFVVYSFDLMEKINFAIMLCIMSTPRFWLTKFFFFFNTDVIILRLYLKIVLTVLFIFYEMPKRLGTDTGICVKCDWKNFTEMMEYEKYVEGKILETTDIVMGNYVLNK